MTLAPALHRLLDDAAQALVQVLGGHSLGPALQAVPTARRPGAQALAFAALRVHGRCSDWLAHTLQRKPPQAVEALLRVAMAQVLPVPGAAGAPSRAYAPHTLVDQAVQAARRRTPAQAGLVNAVLRRVLRERDDPACAAPLSLVGRHEHPAWWIERLQADWPVQWQALLAAAQHAPPFVLRVNPRQGSPAHYRERLLRGDAADGRTDALADTPSPSEASVPRQVRLFDARLPQGLWLTPPCPVSALPGFAQGAVSVQDSAAQLAAPLLIDGGGTLPALRAGARVLDACAAPGGKTAHLLECRPDLQVLALDADATRLQRVDANLQRLGLDPLDVRTLAADAGEVARWWDGQPFDAILLDAPCSASGIGRRHPDVRWLRRPTDIAALQTTQQRLLDALWPLLRPGGRLVYATCSLFAAEGRDQAEAFVRRQPQARRHDVPGFTGHHLGLPENGADTVASDGFFYALFDQPGPAGAAS